MFLKRLSIALCALICFGTLLFGASPESSDNANPLDNLEENIWMAPEANLIPINIKVTPPTCSGDSDGEIEFTITNGTPNYYYRIAPSTTWVSNGANPDVLIDNLEAGSYTIYLKDDDGNTNYFTETVSGFSQLTLNVDPENTIYPECAGEQGVLQLVAGGGDNSNYEYWIVQGGTSSPVNSTGYFDELIGSYDAYVRDGNGCEQIYSDLYFENLAIISISASVTKKINCEDETAEVTVTGIPSNSTVEFFDNNNDPYSVTNTANVYKNFEAGDYTVKVTRNSCPSDYDEKSFSIAAFNDVVMTPTPTSGHVLQCGGDETTTVTVDVTGGKAGEPVTVILDNNNGVADDESYSTTYGDQAFFSNVGVGNYTLRWVDGTTSTCSGSMPYVIDGPESPLTARFVSSTPVLCNGESTGTIQLNVTGGDGNYEYSIDGGSTFQPLPSNQLIEDLSASTGYNIIVQDGNLCENEIEDAISIEQPDPLNLSLVTGAKVDVTCPGGNDGEASFTITGGTEPYYYNLTGPVSRTDQNADANLPIGALLAGDYTLEVYDDNDCFSSQVNFTIDEPNALNIDLFDIDPLVFCYDETTSLSVSVSGGSLSSKTYTLTRAGFSDTKTNSGVVVFDNLISGTYDLSVQSDLACPSIDTSFTIDAPTQIVINNYNDSLMVDCEGELADLSLDITGAEPLTYSVDGGAIENYNAGTPISGLSASTLGQSHSIEIFDANGCSKSISVTLYEPESLSASIGDVIRVSCKGSSNGNVSVTVDGGTPPGYEVTLTGSTGNTYTGTGSTGDIVVKNLPADLYSLQVTDDNGCQLDSPIGGIEVKEPNEDFTINDPVFTREIDCFGGSALVEISASGGWSVDKEIYVSGSNGIDITDDSGATFELPAGSYTITAKNESGCEVTEPLTVSQPDELIISATHNDFSCADANDAEITIEVEGGTPDYSYGLGDVGSGGENPFTGTSTTINTGLAANTYFIEVQDANICRSNIVEVEITKPDPIDFSFSYDTVSCNGASDAMVSITDATGGKDVKYRSFLTDDTGTEVEKSFPDISGLAAGDYSLRITDGSGVCSSPSQPLTIVEPDPVEFHPLNFEVIDIECFKNPATGIIKVDATGGFPNAYELEYKLTGENIETGYQDYPEFSELKAGTYRVTARLKNGRIPDSKRCAVTSEDITIAPAKEIVIASIEVENVLCHNDPGAIQINASGGSGYLEYYIDNDASFTANNSGYFAGVMDPDQPSTTLIVAVSDKQHVCKVYEEITITNPEKLEIEFIKKEDPTCSNIDDGKIYLDVTGGTVAGPEDYRFVDANNTALEYEYEIEGVNGYYVLTGLAGNKTYTPKVIDGTGVCSAILDSTVEIVKPEPVRVADIDWGEKLCYGSNDDKTTIRASGGTGHYYYSMNNGTTLSGLDDSVFVDLEVGEKYPYVEDENGCPNLNEVPSHLFEQPDKFEVYYKFYGIQCYDDEYGDMELKILGGTNNYDVTYNDPDFSETSRIINIPKSSEDTTQFKFLEKNIYLEPNVTYNFYIKDENGCHAQNIDGVRNTSDVFADTIFTIPQQLVLTELRQKPVNCSDDNTGIIEFDATGGTTRPGDGYVMRVVSDGRVPKYNAPGSEMVEKLFAGHYKCYLTDANGCEAVTDLTPLGFNYDTITVAYNNESIKLSISDIYQPTCDRTYDGYIEVNVEDYLFDGVTANVEVYDANVDRYFPLENDEADTIVADEDFSNQDPVNTLFFANGVRVADYITIGDYRITVTDNYTGCDASVDTLITSVDGDNCPEMNRYNYFTPDNGDDYNDEWIIFGSQNQKYTLQIYTSYGELVYDDEDISDNEGIKWDGTDENGRPMPSGTYIYLLRKNEGTPKDTLINGNISIIRSGGK
jgi:gliding motility-associated-like protein